MKCAKRQCNYKGKKEEKATQAMKTTFDNN
jgi:hypothetical protein